MKYSKLLKVPFLPLTASFVLAISSATALADESVWQSSYRLEAVGKYGQAIAAIDPVQVNSPDAEFKLLRRAWLFYLSGSFNESIREYRLAIERNSRSIDARLGILLPYFAEKRWREAEQNARAALELSPNNYLALLRLAIAQEGQRDWGAMEKTAVALVAGYPLDETAHVYLARSEAWLNKRNEAIAAYLAVLARSPENIEAKAYLEKNWTK